MAEGEGERAEKSGVKILGFDRFLGLVVALSGVGYGLTPSTAHARTAVEKIGRNAESMAQIMVNEDLYLGKLRRTLPVEFKNNTEFRSAEAALPGVPDYVIAQITPNAEHRLISRLPAQRAQIAAYLTATMSEGDLAQVLAMMRSPTGRKALNLAQHADPTPVIDELRQSGGRASTEAMQRGVETVLRNNVYGGMTLDEKREFGRFMATPAGVRWGQAQSGLYQVTAKFMNQSLPTEQAEMKKDVLAAVSAYRREHTSAHQ